MADPTGLYFYRARYYHAQLGRFVNRDPAESDANLYRYCGNSPVVRVDPNGLWGKDVHYDLTLAIAQYVGISCPEEVAAGAQRPDDEDDPRTPANLRTLLRRLPGVLHGLPGAEREPHIREAAEQIVETLRYHFPMNADGIVEPGGRAAWDIVGRGMGLNGKCDFKLFSEGLHPLQDSFSHNGRPPFGPFGGHAIGSITLPDIVGTLRNIFRGNFEIARVRAQLRGFLAGLSHSADDPTERQTQFRAMAVETLAAMKGFATRCGTCPCPKSKAPASPRGPVEHEPGDFDDWLKNWYKNKYNEEPEW